MQTALAALLANGYRPTTSEPGHHQLLIQVLPKTIGLGAENIPLLDAYRTARNRSDYSGMAVSDTMALECVDRARMLLSEVRAWIRMNHGDLL